MLVEFRKGNGSRFLWPSLLLRFLVWTGLKWRETNSLLQRYLNSCRFSRHYTISVSCDWAGVYATDETGTNFRAGADCTSAKLMSTPQLTREWQGLYFLLQGEVTVADVLDKKSNPMCLLEQINLAFHMTLALVILYVEKALAVLHVLCLTSAEACQAPRGQGKQRHSLLADSNVRLISLQGWLKFSLSKHRDFALPKRKKPWEASPQRTHGVATDEVTSVCSFFMVTDTGRGLQGKNALRVQEEKRYKL